MSGQPELGITLAEPGDFRRRIELRLVEVAAEHGHGKYSLIDTAVAAEALAVLFQGELARLSATVAAAQYFEWPKDCDGADCDHDDGVCEHLQVRYATADDAIEAGSVPLLKQEVDTLSRGAASAFCLEQAVAELVGMPISAPTSELTAAVVRLASKAGA